MTDKKTQQAQEVREAATAEPQAVADDPAERALRIILEQEIRDDLERINHPFTEFMQAIKTVMDGGGVKVKPEDEAFYREAIQAAKEGRERQAAAVEFIADELEALRKRPGYEGISLYELCLKTVFADTTGPEPPKDEFGELMQRALEKAERVKILSSLPADAEATGKASLETAKPADKRSLLDISAIKYKNSYEIQAATHKLINTFFSVNPPSPIEIAGQMAFSQLQRDGIPVGFERKGAKKEITLYYNYNFDNELLQRYGLEPKITSMEYFVSMITDNLSIEGNTTPTATKIWHELGNTGSPNTDQLQPIIHSLIKGVATKMIVDDSEVQKEWGHRRSRELIMPLISAKLLLEKDNDTGQITDAKIEINDYSPFWYVSQITGQRTTWDKAVLRLYKGRRTARYYDVMKFLMQTIAYMKGGKRSHKIEYATLYAETGTKKRTRDQNLAKQMLFTLLDTVFIPLGYVKSYQEATTGKPGVFLYIPKQRMLTK